MTSPSPEVEETGAAASGERQGTRSGREELKAVLYEAVVAAGWPEVSAETRREQLNRTAAAAWRMVSERQPNDDMRRFKPNIDLAADVLAALADAPEKDRKPVRLIRRVAGDFEFVHDQMHAYLAARWFAQEGFGVAELEKMIESSHDLDASARGASHAVGLRRCIAR